jgi:HAD superfamily hydrolase (TIGR01509 family)
MIFYSNVNQQPTPFQAIIFDMDGLVLDTESTYCIAWQQSAKTMGYTLSDEFCRSFSGLNARHVEQKLLANLGADFNLSEFGRLANDFWRSHVQSEGIAIKPGFNELIEFILEQQIPYCLATNSGAANTRECLELAGLSDVFELMITRDDVLHGKPEPDIFLTAAKQLQVEIGQCLVIEDSHAGILAAHKAGALSILVPSITPIVPETLQLCNAVATDLAQVLATIRA